MHKFHHKKLKQSKGQIIGLDILASVIIFILMFVVLRGIALDNIEKTEKSLQYNEMQIMSQQAFESLTTTEGYPINWTDSSVELIGLARKNNVLDSDKLNYLSLLTYDTAKTKLALGNYDFLLEVTNSTTNFSFGNSPSGEIVVERKRMMYGGEISDVTFKVFK